jgi:hypothetical protein
VGVSRITGWRCAIRRARISSPSMRTIRRMRLRRKPGQAALDQAAPGQRSAPWPGRGVRLRTDRESTGAGWCAPPGGGQDDPVSSRPRRGRWGPGWTGAASGAATAGRR